MAKVTHDKGVFVIWGLSSDDKDNCFGSLVGDSNGDQVFFYEVDTSSVFAMGTDGEWIKQEATQGSGSGGGGGGTTDYEALSNKPKINGVELEGDKSASDLGLASQADLTGYVTKAVLQATIDSATITLPESARDLLNVQYGFTRITDSNAVALMSALMGSIYDGLIDGGADGMIALEIANGEGSRDYIGSIDCQFGETEYDLEFDYGGNKYVIEIARNNPTWFLIDKTPLSGNIPPIEIPDQAYEYLASLPEGSTDVTDTLGSSLAQIFQYIAGLPDSVKAGVTLNIDGVITKPNFMFGHSDGEGAVTFVMPRLFGPSDFYTIAGEVVDDSLEYSVYKTVWGYASLHLDDAQEEAVRNLFTTLVLMLVNGGYENRTRPVYVEAQLSADGDPAVLSGIKKTVDSCDGDAPVRIGLPSNGDIITVYPISHAVFSTQSDRENYSQMTEHNIWVKFDGRAADAFEGLHNLCLGYREYFGDDTNSDAVAFMGIEYMTVDRE